MHPAIESLVQRGIIKPEALNVFGVEVKLMRSSRVRHCLSRKPANQL